MADIRKVLRIFLASPGDLSDERRAAKEFVDEINGQFANAFGYHVELVGWEDTISGFGRPQSIINAELEQCEFFIGLMWKRWGTPPDHSGPYTSGFEEEFERSIQRRKKEGKPEISIFFKEVDFDLLGDPGDELKKVIAFQKKLIDEKTVYYEKFPEVRDLERKIRRCVSNYVVRLQALESTQAASENQTQPDTVRRQAAVQATGAPINTPLSEEGIAFLYNFLSMIRANSEETPIQASEVARFRLLSSIAGRQQNDAHLLGVHDANLIFAHRDDFAFGRPELAGLVGSGLEHYDDENVPLWHWYVAADASAREILPMYSVAGGTVQRRAGAISAMRIISETIPSEPPRKMFLDRWFEDDEEERVKIEALPTWGSLAYPRTSARLSGN